MAFKATKQLLSAMQMEEYKNHQAYFNYAYYAHSRQRQPFTSPTLRPPRHSSNSKKNRSRDNTRTTSHQDIFHAFNLQTQRNTRSKEKIITKRIQTEISPIGKVLCQKAFQFYKEEVSNHKPLADMQRRKQELKKRLQTQIQNINYRTCSIERQTYRQQDQYYDTQKQKTIIKQVSKFNFVPQIQQPATKLFQQIHKTQSLHFMTQKPILTAVNPLFSQNNMEMNVPTDRKQDKQNSNSLGFSCELKLQSNFSISARKSSLSKSSQSLSLKLKSIKLSLSNPMMTETLQKIQIHLTSINYLAQYADWMQEFYKDESEWQVAKYLVYGRFSYERERVYQSLLGSDNCFYLKDLQISELQLQMLINNYIQLKQFTQIINKQNDNVKECLNKIRQSIIKKNIRIQDTSVHFLYFELNREFRILADLLDRGVSLEEEQIYKQRMLSIMQIVFLVEELEGRYVRGFLEAEEMGFREYMNEAYLDYNQIVTNKKRQ